MRFLLLLFLLASFCDSALGNSYQILDLKGFSIGGGTLSPPLHLYQTDEQGNDNGFQFNFLLKADSFHYLTDQLTLAFGMGAELPKSDEVGNKKFPFYITARLHYTIANFSFFIGNMFYFQNQFGTGDTVTLQNGAGESDFYLPNDTRASRNWIVELGAELIFTPEIYLEPALLLVNITNSTKRQLGFLITLNYYFDIKQLELL